MPVSINLATVTASIAAFSITAVYPGDTANSSTSVYVMNTSTMKDDLSAEVARGPVLAPMPNGFFRLDKITIDALGSGANAKKSIYYTLTYRLFYCLQGAGRGFFDVYDAAVKTAMNVLNIVIANDAISGAINLWPMSQSPSIAPVTDAVGNEYWGCDFMFQVMEFINP
jgi:hypothetical protein